MNFYDRTYDIHKPTARLLELPGACPGHAFLRELRQAAADTAPHRLFRALRASQKALDRNGWSGKEVPAAQLETASRQFRERQRNGARALAAAQLGIERRVSRTARSRGSRGIPSGRGRRAQRRRTQTAS